MARSGLPSPEPLGPIARLISWWRELISRPSGSTDSDREPARQPGGKNPDERDKLRVQIRVVREAFGEDPVAPAADGVTGEDDGDAEYLFRPGHALVRDEDLRRIGDFFTRNSSRFQGELERVDERTAPGLSVVRLPARAEGPNDTLLTLDEIDGEMGEGVATPDHVLYVTRGLGDACPATEPEETRSDRPFPPVSDDRSGGSGIRVSVVDTGWWKPAGSSKVTPWLAGVDGDQEAVNPAAIHPYAGHGTFVSGVIRCLAPSAQIEVEGFLTRGGAIYESAICREMDEAIEERREPELISVSAGTHTRKHLPLLGFEMLAKAHGLDHSDKTVVVAAAGNDGSKDKFWPAAFDWVVGVGSVDPDGNLSDYSNRGDWVKVYARGRDLVNAFPDGTYTCYEPQNIHNGIPDVRQFKGMAQWSGTSFSTPIVTGLIAARMSATGEDARTAANAIITGATMMNGLPVVGPLT